MATRRTILSAALAAPLMRAGAGWAAGGDDPAALKARAEAIGIPKRLVDAAALEDEGRTLRLTLRRGRHELEAPLMLRRAKASGHTIIAAHREGTVLSGGRTLVVEKAGGSHGGAEDASGVVRLAGVVPERAPMFRRRDESAKADDAAGLWAYRNGQRLRQASVRAKVGANRTVTLDHALGRESAAIGRDGAWAHGLWGNDWWDERLRVDLADPQGRVLKLLDQPKYGLRPGTEVTIENLVDGPLSEDVFLYDREATTINVAPTLTGDKIAVRALVHVVRLDHCADIAFEGIGFEMARGDLVDAVGCRNIAFRGCDFTAGGGWALTATDCTGLELDAVTIDDMDCGGVRLSGGDRVQLASSGNLVRGTRITRFGRQVWCYLPAVKIAGVGARLVANQIDDGPHCAILFEGNDHRILRNTITSVCTKTGDCGAIYVDRDWTAQGTLIRDNQIRSVIGIGEKGATAIYLDDCSSGITVEDNDLRACGIGVLIGGGRDNIVRDNHFEKVRTPIYADARGLEWKTPAGDRIRTNLEEKLEQAKPAFAKYRERYAGFTSLERDDRFAPIGNKLYNNSFEDCGENHITKVMKRFIQDKA